MGMVEDSGRTEAFAIRCVLGTRGGEYSYSGSGGELDRGAADAAASAPD